MFERREKDRNEHANRCWCEPTRMASGRVDEAHHSHYCAAVQYTMLDIKRGDKRRKKKANRCSLVFERDELRVDADSNAADV